MEKPIYVFEPLNHSTDPFLWLSISILIAMLFISFVINQFSKLDRNRRLTILMICFFIGAIAAATTGFRLFSQWKIKPIQLFGNRIETPYGIVPFNQVRDYYIKLERHYKPMNPSVVTDSARYFFLLERTDKTHVLSEGDYPVDSILAKMNEVMGY